MPLEFALRPRFDLERPAPRRRFGWLRLPRLALPIAAYWLTIAGVTHTLIRLATASPVAAPELGVTSEPAYVPDTPPSDSPAVLDTSSPSSASASAPIATDAPIAELPPERDDEPASVFVPAERELGSEHLVEALPSARLPVEDREPPSRRERQPRLAIEQSAPPPPAPFDEREEPAAPLLDVRDESIAPAPPRAEANLGSLPSCESAAAAANQTIDLRSARRAPDLTRGAFAAVLENGAYLAQCAIPARTALEICAAVQDGKVVGVSVTTTPRDPAIGACVRRAVGALRFPRNAALDVTRTRFEPAL